MLDFAFRNLILFFKDRTAVILSFLAEFIVIGLYILFIRNNLLDNFQHLKEPELLIDIWMIAGILGITSVSTTMGVYGILIEDKSNKIYRDFIISPLKNHSLVGGYLTSAFFVGLILTFLVFVVSEVYLHITYGVHPGADRILWIYILFILTVFSNTSMTLLLVSYLNSSQALAACCTILGTLIGFLTGIYLPIGTLPESVQIAIKCFPVSHSVILFRQALMEPFIETNFQGLETDAAQEFMEIMGICFSCHGDKMSLQSHVFVLIAVICGCGIGIMYRFSRER